MMKYVGLFLLFSVIDHIRCQEPVTLRGHEKILIVNVHNSIRRQVVPSAVDMTEMRWNTLLEASAQRYAEQCIFSHGTGREVGTPWEWVGENLYARRGVRDIARGLTRWINERSLYDYYSNQCVQGGRCGHYTQMVSAASANIGCGIAFCPLLVRRRGNWRNAYNFVCHYGPGGNVVGFRPYTAGPSCSRCPWYMPSCRGGLCTFVCK